MKLFYYREAIAFFGRTGLVPSKPLAKSDRSSKKNTPINANAFIGKSAIVRERLRLIFNSLRRISISI